MGNNWGQDWGGKQTWVVPMLFKPLVRVSHLGGLAKAHILVC